MASEKTLHTRKTAGVQGLLLITLRAAQPLGPVLVTRQTKFENPRNSGCAGFCVQIRTANSKTEFRNLSGAR